MRILDRLATSENPKIQERAGLIKKMIKHSDIDDFKHLVRTRIGDKVVHGNMFEKNLGIEGINGKFDVISSNFVAESASETLEQWEQSMQNMMAHIKKGGYFVQTAIKNASWYEVGKEKLPAFGVYPEQILSIHVRNLDAV